MNATELKKAQNTIISSVDDILDKSFIGSLKDIIYDVRALELAAQQRWQEQMNGWLVEHEELRKQR